MSLGPVLTAIEEGHYARTPQKGKPVLCGKCGLPWSCPTITTARQQQAKYGEHLRLSRLVAPDTRKTYI